MFTRWLLRRAQTNKQTNGWPSYAVPVLERLLITRGAANTSSPRSAMFESCTALRQIHAGEKAAEVQTLERDHQPTQADACLKWTINRLKEMHA
jgi:hypothetical protein